MLQQQLPDADVGVIVGRFQVHKLHAGHHDLIESVRVRHQKVVIFLGHRPGVLGTRGDPLDFQSRKAMLETAYPALITILPLPDKPRDNQWSADLDRRIAEVTEGLSVQLYGSRDSFVPSYQGRYPVVELAASFHQSGTEIRKSISNSVRASQDFRHGVVYSAFNRHPTSFQCVDAAVIRARGQDNEAVLLGRKNTDPSRKWRFFGGFVSPKDESLERAASRELHEEAPGISVHVPGRYLGSSRVGDWRYRGGPDGIMTALFAFDYMSGGIQAADDMDGADFIATSYLTENTFVEDHRPLFQLLKDYLNA